MEKAAAREGFGETPVVEGALSLETGHRRVDLVLGMTGPLQGTTYLGLGVVAPGQPRQGPPVGGKGGRSGRLAWQELLHPRAVPSPYSTSKDCIVFSISSAAMSEVLWTPWILSLNSSGLLARRRASS